MQYPIRGLAPPAACFGPSGALEFGHFRLVGLAQSMKLWGPRSGLAPEQRRSGLAPERRGGLAPEGPEPVAPGDRREPGVETGMK
jgi:hypothetical protein